jgi:hypothetical protein
MFSCCLMCFSFFVLLHVHMSFGKKKRILLNHWILGEHKFRC